MLDDSKREQLKTDSTSFELDDSDENSVSEDDEGLDVVLSRRPGAEILLEGGLGDEDSDEESRVPVDVERNVAVEQKFWTTSMKTLGLTALLFTVITILQVFGAAMANSKALLVDCISMGVDAGTYLGNMVVEYKRHSRHHAPFELAVGGISLVTLIYFTVDALRESYEAISPDNVGEDEDVNAWIIFGFALGGLLFDAVSLYAFRRSHRKTRSGREMNMWTALLHVGADFLRSATTLVSSMMILFLGYDGVAVDAWASILVGATILLGAGFGLAGWIRKFLQWSYA